MGICSQWQHLLTEYQVAVLNYRAAVERSDGQISQMSPRDFLSKAELFGALRQAAEDARESLQDNVTDHQCSITQTEDGW